MSLCRRNFNYIQKSKTLHKDTSGCINYHPSQDPAERDTRGCNELCIWCSSADRGKLSTDTSSPLSFSNSHHQTGGNIINSHEKKAVFQSWFRCFKSQFNRGKHCFYKKWEILLWLCFGSFSHLSYVICFLYIPHKYLLVHLHILKLFCSCWVFNESIFTGSSFGSRNSPLILSTFSLLCHSLGCTSTRKVSKNSDCRPVELANWSHTCE